MSRHCSSVKSVGYDLSFIAPLPQNLTPTRRVNNSPDQMSRDNNCLKFRKPCNGHALSRREPAKAEGLAAQRARPTKQGLVNPHHGVVNIVDAETHYARVLDVRAYFAWRVELALHRIPVASGRYGDAAQKLGDWKAMIGAQVRGGKPGRKYGLPSELRARFLRIIHPDSPENPFDPAHRYRNFGSSFFCVHSFWKKLRAEFSPMRRRALCGAEGRIRHDRTWTA